MPYTLFQGGRRRRRRWWRPALGACREEMSDRINQQRAGNTGRGGAQNADFETLIDLIQSTVAVESWADNGGGNGDMRPFYGGVYVDAAGTLKLKSTSTASAAATADLQSKRLLASPTRTKSTASARSARCPTARIFPRT